MRKKIDSLKAHFLSQVENVDRDYQAVFLVISPREEFEATRAVFELQKEFHKRGLVPILKVCDNPLTAENTNQTIGALVAAVALACEAEAKRSRLSSCIVRQASISNGIDYWNRLTDLQKKEFLLKNFPQGIKP